MQTDEDKAAQVETVSAAGGDSVNRGSGGGDSGGGDCDGGPIYNYW